jgi:hypothetical protein
MRRSWLLVLLLALLTACAGVPGSSEPVAVRHVDGSEAAGEDPDVQVVPPGPAPHMSTRDIVDGFLKASSAGVDARHQVARRFLTPAAAATWDDAAQSTVYTEPLVDDRPGGGSVKVTAEQIAIVGQDGTYHPDRGRVVVQLRLAKVKGEWRIENPPPGIFVRSSDFAQNFHSANVYFLNPNRTAVVPDPRYFEVPTTSMANRLIQALLSGPSQWLMPAAVTDIPKGTTLRTNVVDDSPTVTVDLDHLAPMNKAQLKGMSAQIVFTLAKFNSSAVRILSDGQPLAGVRAQQQLSDWQSLDPEALPASAPLYFVRSGSVWTSDGSRAKGPAGSGYYALSSVSVPVDGSKMAGISKRSGRDELWVGRMGHTLYDRFDASRLTAPTWGGQSTEVWTVRNGTDIVRVPFDVNHGEPQIIAAPEVSKIAPITELRLSRDGTRVALIGNHGGLYLGRVSRTSDSVTVDGVHNVAPSMRGFTDVTWAAGDGLLALAPNSTNSLVPWDIAIDGSSRHAEGIDTLPAQPTGIAAASDRLTVVSSKQELWYYDRSSWTRVTVNGNSNAMLSGTAPNYPD